MFGAVVDDVFGVVALVCSWLILVVWVCLVVCKLCFVSRFVGSCWDAATPEPESMNKTYHQNHNESNTQTPNSKAPKEHK